MGWVMQKSMYQLDNNFKCELMPHDLNTLKFLNQDIEALAYLYPEIKEWYWNVFAMGFASNEREVLIAKDSSGQFAGFSLLKNSQFEKKICTFYILPEFRESGLAKQLMPVSIEMLGQKNIGITVSESVDGILNRLLSANDFVVENTEIGLYLPTQKEFIYKLA